MDRAVIDTNVLVSAFIKADSKPGRILGLILSGRIMPCVNGEMMEEYSAVLRRERFGFDPRDVAAALEFFLRLSVRTPPMIFKGVPPDDAVFASAAIHCRSKWLITGNKRHFGGFKGHSFRVVTPEEFLKEI